MEIPTTHYSHNKDSSGFQWIPIDSNGFPNKFPWNPNSVGICGIHGIWKIPLESDGIYRIPDMWIPADSVESGRPPALNQYGFHKNAMESRNSSQDVYGMIKCSIKLTTHEANRRY